MKKKIIFISILFCTFLILFITIQKNIGNFDNKFFTKIKLIIPDNVKKVLKEKIFVYSYINILQNEISKKDKNLIDLSYKFSSTHGMYFKKLIDKKIITSKKRINIIIQNFKQNYFHGKDHTGILIYIMKIFF